MQWSSYGVDASCDRWVSKYCLWDVTMLLLGYLTKVQGLKGEFLFHGITDNPERLLEISDLLLVPPGIDLECVDAPAPVAKFVQLGSFRFHKNRACIAFKGIQDRTASEPYRNWALWTTGDLPILTNGDSYRHDWVGCCVYVDGIKIGKVECLKPTPMEYDMVVISDMRPGRSGNIEVPYIKTWFKVDFIRRCIEMNPPLGLLDLNI